MTQTLTTTEELKHLASSDNTNELTRSLARECLANREAQPVAWSYEWASCITCEGPQNFQPVIEREAPPEWTIDEGQARNIIPLYTAPPAPVSEQPMFCVDMDSDFIKHIQKCSEEVATWPEWKRQGSDATQFTATAVPTFEEWLSTQENKPLGWVRDSMKESYDACRAAMLAQPVSQGGKLVPVEPTAEMIQSGIAAHYERQQLQIHDRPAPGPMECAYIAMLAAAPEGGNDA